MFFYCNQELFCQMQKFQHIFILLILLHYLD
nr:MAG TPA: hypothetical protein [Bacteriophage sp.]